MNQYKDVGPSESGIASVSEEHEFSKHDDPLPAYLSGLELYSVALALTLTMLILTLDITILATAVPKITDQFHTINDIGWYPAAYLITNSALQPLTGKLYKHFPIKTVFLCFVVLFEVGSLLCGVAVSSKMLIVGRAVAGMGGSGLLNGSFNIIGSAAPPEKRPLDLGLLTSLAAGGQVIGPLIGGALTEHASWRWCFYINLPVGAITLIFIFCIRFPQNKSIVKTVWTVKTVFQVFDLIGFAIFAPACVMMLLALQWGDVDLPWESATVIGLLCGSAVAFIVFAVWEYKQGDIAMIPFNILKIRVVYSSLFTSAFQGGNMMVLGYYLPMWFQAIKGASPTMSGVYTLPIFIPQILFSSIAGYLVPKVGYLTPFVLCGATISAVASGLMSTFTLTTGAGAWIGYQILAGVGRGFSLQMPIQAAQSSVAPGDIPTATALVTFSQFFGGAITVALARTAFANLLLSALHSYASTINANAIFEAGATNYVSLVDDTALAARMDPAATQRLRHSVEFAYNVAITQTYYLAVGTACAAVLSGLGMGWKKKIAVKKKGDLIEKQEQA